MYTDVGLWLSCVAKSDHTKVLKSQKPARLTWLSSCLLSQSACIFFIFQGQFVARFFGKYSVITIFDHICILIANPRIKLCIFFCIGSWELLSGLIRYQIKKWVNSFFVALSLWSNIVSKGGLKLRPLLNAFFYSVNAMLIQEDYFRSPLSWVFQIFFFFPFWAEL